ncbi:glycosyltransferase family 2 protein [Helicobacter burdigaliensis]|uniref:glycosyltransferase family 2 protein n=1 Tax=Helicobacter burdigaliensis TaxID=2315334 RepID=UPI000EF6AADA|nr:glycosyltransferase family 2 protein [Helicobacter burdigaliensis]
MFKISIIMACYNSAAYLQRSIGSVLKQTYQNWELICVDDESNDGTYDKLLEFSRKDNRVKVFSKKNSGMAAPNFNFALDYVSGDFIFVLGHDDEINSICLESFIKRYDEIGDEEIDAIVPRSVMHFPEDTRKNWMLCGIDRKLETENKVLSGLEAFELSIFWKISGFAFFRADIVKKLGFYEEGMNGDEYSCREFFLNSRKVAFVREGIYKYYQLETSITKKLSPKIFDTYKTFYRLEELAKKNNLKSSLIKKINKERYAQAYNLWEKYLKNKYLFSQEELQKIERHFEENYRLLMPYKTFKDLFFRKSRDRRGKSIVILDSLKFYYKKLKNV